MCPCFRFRFKNNYFSEMCSGSEEGSYLRLIDFCITQRARFAPGRGGMQLYRCTQNSFLSWSDRLNVGWLNGFSFIWEGTTRAEDAQGTPTQSHISPSILVYEDETNPHPTRVKRFITCERSHSRYVWPQSRNEWLTFAGAGPCRRRLGWGCLRHVPRRGKRGVACRER